MRSKAFAQTVKSADAYFVIISREKLPQLPYSIDEVYGLREGDGSGRYHNPKRIYNEMYRIFGKTLNLMSAPDIIITEDSNSGNEFFDILFPHKCISSKGKSNIKRLIAQNADRRVLAVVDGAAFGPEMQDCIDIVNEDENNVLIYAPESFEYLILESGVIEVPKHITEETWDYADSVKYFSWEEFYTRYLVEITQNSIGKYSKNQLSEYYKTTGNVDRISKVMPECIRKWI